MKYFASENIVDQLTFENKFKIDLGCLTKNPIKYFCVTSLCSIPVESGLLERTSSGCVNWHTPVRGHQSFYPQWLSWQLVRTLIQIKSIIDKRKGISMRFG
jgi:hypothetical protein